MSVPGGGFDCEHGPIGVEAEEHRLGEAVQRDQLHPVVDDVDAVRVREHGAR